MTGGASGLGKATVERFIQNGLRVIVADLPTSEGEQLAKSFNGNCTFIPMDISSVEQIQDAFQVIKSSHGKLDYLVNCAGTARAFQTYNFNKKSAVSLEHINQCMKVSSDKRNF